MKSNQDRPTWQVCRDIQYGTVLYSILREDCSVEIDRMQATNPQLGGGKDGGRTHFKQVGTGGNSWGGAEVKKEGEGVGWGRTPDTKPPRDQSHPTRISVKRTQCMRRKQGNTRRKRGAQLPVWGECSGRRDSGRRGGGIDWWRLLRGVGGGGSGTYQNQSGMHHASVFSKRETALEKRRKRVNGEQRDGTVLRGEAVRGERVRCGVKNRGRSQPHIAENQPPWTDRQTHTQECCTYNHLWRESGGSGM